MPDKTAITCVAQQFRIDTYIIVRHQDREHPHVHIVFNRIDNNGKSISDRNDMYLSLIHICGLFGEQGYVSVYRNHLALLTAKEIAPVGRNF